MTADMVVDDYLVVNGKTNTYPIIFYINILQVLINENLLFLSYG